MPASPQFDLEPRIPPNLQAKFDTVYTMRQKRSLKFACTVSGVMVGYYYFLCHWNSTLHIFFRAQSCFSLLLEIVITIGVCRGWLKKFTTDWMIFLGLLHYIFYTTLNYHRASKLTGWDGWAHEEETEEEAYVLILNYFIIATCGYFNLLRLPHFLLLTCLAPVIWISQIQFLGTTQEFTCVLRVGGIYCALNLLAFVGAKRTSFDLASEFLRNERERSEVLGMLEQASAPILLVSAPPGLHNQESAPLRIELWNQGLQQLTGTSNLGGGHLEEAACVHPKHRKVLANAIRLTLSNDKVTTADSSVSVQRRLLIQLFHARGAVWLQVDIWRVSMDGPKAIIIGSDVSAFVAEHASLLHEMEGADRHSLHGTSEDDSKMFAVVNPWTFILSECSAGFNIFFQQRMEGASILQRILTPQDRQAVTEAAAMAAKDSCQPVRVLRVSVDSKVTTKVNHRFHRSSGIPAKRINIKFSSYEHDRSASSFHSIGCQSNQGGSGCKEPLVLIQILDFESVVLNWQPGLPCVPEKGSIMPNRARSEPDEDLHGRDRRLCHDLHMDKTEDQSKRRLPAVHPCQSEVRSDPGQTGDAILFSLNASSAGKSLWHQAIGMDTCCDESTMSGGANNHEAVQESAHHDIPSSVLQSHLVELSRHLRRPTFQEALKVLLQSVESALENCTSLSERWQEPCSGWECMYCYAMNDSEDDFCEVCKVEHEGQDGAD